MVEEKHERGGIPPGKIGLMANAWLKLNNFSESQGVAKLCSFSCLGVRLPIISLFYRVFYWWLNKLVSDC